MVEREAVVRDGQLSRIQAALYIKAVTFLGYLPPEKKVEEPKNHIYRPVFRYCARRK